MIISLGPIPHRRGSCAPARNGSSAHKPRWRRRLLRDSRSNSRHNAVESVPRGRTVRENMASDFRGDAKFVIFLVKMFLSFRYPLSGKHTKNYEKSPFFHGKIHYFYGNFQ